MTNRLTTLSPSARLERERAKTYVLTGLLIGALVAIVFLLCEVRDLGQRNLEVVAEREELRHLALEHNLIEL